ncbi:FAD-binding oxidoreductase [Roseibacillus ishigakijimensis]|uniref:FAD-binding oxidoreductase n=1 Tax=Roseibacillus ishigakijimensis TaxID=454146 RepID=A0A934RUT2_9BACT|nr:FAD-binding oxidoreductase [Roseibacillus ishigakijimensis]MBK1834555.1 FAD-binding oxidoreductase [Roseibacillus ishigakijimensis]
MKGMESWGRYPKLATEKAYCWWLQDVSLQENQLPVGLGRSYGDSGLPREGGTALVMEPCQRLVSFDEATGVLRAEAGISLGSLLQWAVPRGWFLPVVPGTRHVTLGGAVANDIHGKNHHRDGTFGCWVESFSLSRREGGWQEVAPGEDLFEATIGGLGLTGVMGEISLRLQKIPAGGVIEQETSRFSDLIEACDQLEKLDEESPMTVAWLDLGSRDRVSGVAMGGRFVESEKEARLRSPKLSVPVTAPEFLLNPLSISAFNRTYDWTRRNGTTRVGYPSYFFPLDGVGHWNRLYGKRGFLQYQFVVKEREALIAVVDAVLQSRQRPFLSVLKKFGDRQSPGWLSFPQQGWTLAMDFPMRGEETLQLLARMDEIVRVAGGRLYAAKDARMEGDFFRESYPDWQRLEKWRDPAIMSAFWQRVSS